MGLLTFLGACGGGHGVDQYAGSEPPLNLQSYFTGPIKAWGIIQDFKGKVIVRFDVDMVGRWDGDTGTLEEQFAYYSGRTQRRVWTITRMADGSYTGDAGDIIGSADGRVNGSAMRWRYQMDLEVEGRTHRISFDDWLFQMNDGVMINRSYLKKFGFTVAELTLFMHKQES